MQTKQIIIASLGNTLEWLDFGLFIFMAPIIGAQFFPATHALTNTLSALSVFFAGFICRPLGGILFGHAGDTQGRAKTLRLSILIMSISLLLIGVLPTYQSLGIASTFIFIILRLIQGISVGGEYGGTVIYLAESAPIHQRGLMTSFAAIGANCGFLLASFLLFVLHKTFSHEALLSFGWRLPFLFVGGLGTILFFLRFHLKETPVYSTLEKNHQLQKQPFRSVYRHAPQYLWKIIGLCCMNATVYYVFFGYMPNYLHIYHGMQMDVALLIQNILLVFMIILIPLAGICGDKFGRRNLLKGISLALIVFAIPCFLLLQMPNPIAVFMALTFATFISSVDQGNTLCALVENVPANIRYSGISFAYNLGNAVFGGTAPLMLTLLTEKINPIAPACYLMAMAVITFIAASSLLNDSKVKISFLHDAESAHEEIN